MFRFSHVGDFSSDWYHLRSLNTYFMRMCALLQNTFAIADCFGVQPVVYKAYYCQF